LIESKAPTLEIVESRGTPAPGACATLVVAVHKSISGTNTDVYFSLTIKGNEDLEDLSVVMEDKEAITKWAIGSSQCQFPPQRT
jgi:hypothetical protein